jgi:hypothetical protein
VVQPESLVTICLLLPTRANLSRHSRRNLILFATMQYVRLLSWVKPHIGTTYNLADLFTRALYGQARCFLVGRLMYDVFLYMAKAPTDKT